MTGLLKKDLSLTMVNKKLFMIIPFVALMLLVMGNGDNVSFVMGYLCLLYTSRYLQERREMKCCRNLKTWPALIFSSAAIWTDWK